MNFKQIIEFSQLHIMSMTLYKDIWPYFNKYIHIHGCNLSTCILLSPLKNMTHVIFTKVNLFFFNSFIYLLISSLYFPFYKRLKRLATDQVEELACPSTLIEGLQLGDLQP